MKMPKLCVMPAESVTVTKPGKPVAAAVGVPLIAPEAEMCSPAGSTATVEKV